MIHTPPGSKPVPGPEYLQSTRFLDSDSDAVRAFAQQAAGAETSDIGRAVKLFYAVRDSIRYDPFAISLGPDLRREPRSGGKVGLLHSKAILLAAARRAGSPAPSDSPMWSII
jgi:hypothetical protein